MTAYRYIKDLARQMRGGWHARCDLLGIPIGKRNVGELHHMVIRMGGNEDIFEAATNTRLCAFLSSKAHKMFHDKEPSPEHEEIMWQSIYRAVATEKQFEIDNELDRLKWARDEVRIALDDLQSLMKTDLRIMLPEPRIAESTVFIFGRMNIP